MFNSTILDVAAGTIFGFLAVSLFTSAAVEALNSLLKLRSRNLLSGVKALVNDPGFNGLAKALYQHAAVNPLGPGGTDPRARSPAYIDARQFAGALLDITGLSAAKAELAGQAPGPQAIKALQERVDTIGDPQLRQMMRGMVDRSAGDLTQVRTELSAWFDNGMDRLSGSFKRWTQLATFVVALTISVVVNVDSIRVATLLWEHPLLADQLRASAIQASLLKGTTDEQILAASALETTMQAGLPVGWAPGHFFEAVDGKGAWAKIWQSSTVLWSICGWVVTAVSALFGAPFWFDTLQMFVRLRGTGPSPGGRITGASAQM